VEEPGRRYALSKLEELQGEDNEGFDKGDERKLKNGGNRFIQPESMPSSFKGGERPGFSSEVLQGKDNQGFDMGDERKLKNGGNRSIQQESMPQASSSSTTVLALPVLSPTVVSLDIVLCFLTYF
jgi:uncharacterized protein YodC (DUF2158 family)